MTKIGDYETHPYADAFPRLAGDEYERFKQDIKDNGLRDRDIWTYEGKILDGRNRLQAYYDLCKFAEVTKPRIREWEGDPMALVISANLHRRQLNQSQRAIVACRLYASKPGRRPKAPAAQAPTRAIAAGMLGISEDLATQAQKVVKDGIPEVVAAIDRGDITVGTALELVDLPGERQLELLNKALTGGDNRRARSNIVRQGTRRKDETPDTIMVLARAVMRTTTQLGGTVKQGTTSKDDEGRTDRCELEVGFQGRVLTLTIAVDDPETT